MQRRRSQQPALPARRGALLVSLLVLVAFALSVPMSATADSAGVQYEDAIPSAIGGGGSAGGQTSSQGGAGAEGAASTSGRDGSGKANAKGAKNGGGASGSGNLRAGLGDGSAVGDPLNPSSTAAGDGGSSPLLPAVFGLLALAAISGLTLMARARRQKRQAGAGRGPGATSSIETG